MNPKWKKLLGRLAMILTISLMAVTPALAVEYIDIDQPNSTGGASPTNELNDWQQTFTPNVNNITAVSIFILDGYTANSVTIQVLDSVCGNILASGSSPGGVGWVKCDLEGAEAVVPGNTYVAKIISDAPIAIHSYNPYTGGLLYHNCSPWGSGSTDLKFRTWTDEEAVPNTDSTWGSVKSLFR